MKYTASALTGFALVSSATAHLFIQSPKPIAGSGIKQPLDASGSDFPCHGVTLPGSGGQSMAVGSVQQLIFDGGSSGENTAVHGGGSCQISITYETDPQKVKDPANWKVLYSIIGGCPTNSPMNLDSSYTGPDGNSYSGSRQCSDPTTNGYNCLNSFPFTIPKEVKNGQATLGWTWFNNIGNREMYMNCVSVDISGGKSDDSGLNTLPNLFVANIAAKGVPDTCRTSERSNVGIPAPGQYVLTKKASPRMAMASATDYPILVPSGCPAAASYYSSGNVPAPAPATTAPATTAPATTAPATTAPATTAPATTAPATTAPVTTAPVTTAPSTTAPATTAPATTLQKTTSPADPPSTSTPIKRPVVEPTSTTTTAAATTSAAAATTTPKTSAAASTSTTAAATTASSAAPPAGTCGAGRVPCSTLGSIVCVGQSKFGICDYGNCAIAQAVAPGTACIDGGITWAPAAKKKKKARRHLMEHIHNSGHHI